MKEVYLHNALDEINKILKKFDWIDSYEVFIQSINWLIGSSFNDEIMSLNHRNRRGYALRLISKGNRLVEFSGSLSNIPEIRNIKPPKSTKSPTDLEEFSMLKQPRQTSIIGDKSRSTEMDVELIEDQLNLADSSNPDDIPLSHKIDLLKEEKLITNSHSPVLYDSNLHTYYDVSTKFEIDNQSFSLSRSKSQRSLFNEFNDTINDLLESVSVRVNLPLQDFQDDYAIILHPDVLGRLLTFHSTKFLSDTKSSDITKWSSNLQLYDDPLRDYGMSSTILDDEGVLTKEKLLIDGSQYVQQLSHSALDSGGNKGNGYRASWFEPLPRSYEFPINTTVTNLVLVGGTGKGKYFTDNPYKTVLIKKGYGFTGVGISESSFIIHANEAEIWQSGTLLGPIENITLFGDIDEVMSKGQLSSDEYPVVDKSSPGSIYLGWMSLAPGIVKLR